MRTRELQGSELPSPEAPREAAADWSRLRVASYNVHGCVGSDGRHDVARVANVLRELDADVIALQEVECQPQDRADDGRDEAGTLLAGLSGMHALWAPIHERHGRQFGNAMFTRVPLRRSRLLDLSYQGREARAALDVELELAGPRVRIVATHLGLRPGERRFQVQKILQSVEHDAEDPRAMTVLLGDINEWFIAGRPLRWLHRHFGHSPTPALRTFPASCPLLALDRVWVHPAAALTGVRRHLTRDSRKASDHLPIVADIARL